MENSEKEIIFKNRTPEKRYISLGIKKDNNAEIVPFRIELDDKLQEAVLQPDFELFLLVSNEHIVDKIPLDFEKSEGVDNVITTEWTVAEKYTTSSEMECQLLFETPDLKLHTEKIFFNLGAVIDINKVVSLYPFVLEDLESRVSVLERTSTDLDEVPTEDSENAVMSGGVFEAIKQAKFTAEIVDRQIVITFADGSEILLSLPDEVVSGEVVDDEIVLTLDSEAEIKIDLSTVLSKKIDNLDGNIVAENGVLSIEGDLHIKGDIMQQGENYETHAEQVYSTKDKIILREGAEWGLLPTETTGIVAKKYDNVNDGELVFGADGIARVGDVGDTQPLATREEIPVSEGLAYWDNVGLKFETSAGLTKEYLEGKLDKTDIDLEVELPVRIKVDDEFEDLSVSLGDLKTAGEVLATKKWVESIEKEPDTSALEQEIEKIKIHLGLFDGVELTFDTSANINIGMAGRNGDQFAYGLPYNWDIYLNGEYVNNFTGVTSATQTITIPNSKAGEHKVLMVCKLENTDYCARSICFMASNNIGSYDKIVSCKGYGNAYNGTSTMPEFCFYAQFDGCLLLTYAPDLPPALIVTSCSYDSMFKNTNLITAPDIFALSIKNRGCQSMFRGCSNLEVAPVIYATTIEKNQHCFRYIFQDCTKLTEVKMHYASNLGANDATDWLKNITTTGTLYSPNAVITYGLPANWTAQPL